MEKSRFDLTFFIIMFEYYLTPALSILFGKLLFAVSLFISNSMKLADLTLSGNRLNMYLCLKWLSLPKDLSFPGQWGGGLVVGR